MAIYINKKQKRLALSTSPTQQTEKTTHIHYERKIFKTTQKLTAPTVPIKEGTLYIVTAIYINNTITSPVDFIKN